MRPFDDWENFVLSQVKEIVIIIIINIIVVVIIIIIIIIIIVVVVVITIIHFFNQLGWSNGRKTKLCYSNGKKLITEMFGTFISDSTRGYIFISMW